MHSRTSIPAFVLALLAIFSGISCNSEKLAPAHPNVVVILSDDQGWGDFSHHGNTDLSMPALDRLASEGAWFEHFYVQPVCSPTRAEFLTGRYHPRSGIRGTSAGGERLDLDEHTIAETFRAAGYATAIFGKWHNGSQYPYHPNARGFDEFYGFTSGHWGHYFSPALEHNFELVKGNGYVADDLTEHAMEFIEQHRDEPFFVYVPLNIPHSPMQVPDRFFDKFADAAIEMPPQDSAGFDLDHTRAAYAMCENIDWNVGRILDKLDELDLTGQTIVLYFSDNGPNGWRWNGNLRGRKGSTDEGGVRSPLFVRWPGHIKPETRITEIAGAIDLLPTLADAAGIELKAEKPIDGISLKPLLEGTVSSWPDRYIFSHWNGRVSVRSSQYRLDHEGRLYDINEDPGQEKDISPLKPDLHEELTAAAEAWRAEVLSELPPEDDRPFPVAYSITHLPARDGIPHGGIERSNRFPNDSHFTNWTDETGYITWDIDVKTGGRYEAIVHYTCPEEDLGAAVTLSFANAHTEAVVTEAFDPPLVGADHDRSSRQESYVKDFRPMSLGVIELEPGRGALKLAATSIPGAQAMDVRRVTLKLLEDR